jgi:hypothetical protein
MSSIRHNGRRNSRLNFGLTTISKPSPKRLGFDQSIAARRDRGALQSATVGTEQTTVDVALFGDHLSTRFVCWKYQVKRLAITAQSERFQPMGESAAAPFVRANATVCSAMRLRATM